MDIGLIPAVRFLACELTFATPLPSPPNNGMRKPRILVAVEHGSISCRACWA